MGYRLNSEDSIPNPNNPMHKGKKLFSNASFTSFNDLPDPLKERLEKCAKQVTDILSDSMESKVCDPSFKDIDPQHVYMACMVEFMAHLQIMVNDLFEVSALLVSQLNSDDD
jgi:hypothetical protein